MEQKNICENRYSLIKEALKNRIIALKDELAYDLRCLPEQIPEAELVERISSVLKKPLDDFWGGEDVAYYLFEQMIDEEINQSSYQPKQVQNCLKKWMV